MAMCQAVKKAVRLVGLLQDIGIALRTPLVLYGDDQGALEPAQNPVFHSRSKYIDGKHHPMRELVQANRITVKYIAVSIMLAGASPRLSLKLSM